MSEMSIVEKEGVQSQIYSRPDKKIINGGKGGSVTDLR